MFDGAALLTPACRADVAMKEFAVLGLFFPLAYHILCWL
jgi:hypothetical protein